jgi:hypothetical protein
LIETSSKPAQKPKRNWRRILAAAFLCAIPFSNPLFFLTAYDQSQLSELQCPRCKRSATELAGRTLRYKNKRFDIILEYRCLSCGAVWQRWEQRSFANICA